MFNKEMIKDLFKDLHSYTAVANVIGCSRQYVNIVVRGYRNTGKSRFGKRISLVWKEYCEICKVNKTAALHHKDLDNKNDDVKNLLSVCVNCHGLIHHNERMKILKSCSNCGRDFKLNVKVGNIKKSLCKVCTGISLGTLNGRNTFYTDFHGDKCKICGKATEGKRRWNGYHVKCYWKTEEGRKFNNERHKLYYKNVLSKDPEFKKKQSAANRKSYLKRRGIAK